MKMMDCAVRSSNSFDKLYIASESKRSEIAKQASSVDMHSKCSGLLGTGRVIALNSTIRI